MTPKNYIKSEHKIIDLCKETKNFQYGGETFHVVTCEKPRPQIGECKTDVYIKAINTKTEETKEFKISVKQGNADFLENKIKLERAIEIFGENAQSIIKESILAIKQAFLDDFLINFEQKGRIEKFCIKLGWKFELLNKPGGEKSGLLKLTDDQKLGVYSGSNNNLDKKDCFVDGKRIKDSGVANFLLVIDKAVDDLQYYIDRIIPIEEFINGKNIYFACKALNYRCCSGKWDGDRPLAVCVDWKLIDGKLHGDIIFDNPLSTKGNAVGCNVRKLLSELGIDSSNFENLRQHLSPNINVYP